MIGCALPSRSYENSKGERSNPFAFFAAGQRRLPADTRQSSIDTRRLSADGRQTSIAGRRMSVAGRRLLIDARRSSIDGCRLRIDGRRNSIEDWQTSIEVRALQPPLGGHSYEEQADYKRISQKRSKNDSWAANRGREFNAKVQKRPAAWKNRPPFALHRPAVGFKLAAA